MSPDRERPSSKALLSLPHIRVQNANAISSPMTWGFPSITAFAGLMTALERKLGPEAGIAFHGVGVVCHGFEPQIDNGGYTRTFKLTRNPVLADGSTAAIVEEGRAHLDITLVFDVELVSSLLGEAERLQLVDRVSEMLSGMRIAGGSVMPRLPIATRRWLQPSLTLQPDREDERLKWFRRLARRWLPGFALIGRDDLLVARHQQLLSTNPKATMLDAWLDLSRLTYRASTVQPAPGDVGEEAKRTQWSRDDRPGWIVPIPVGYCALSDVYPGGSVARARDATTPFRFVETVYSIGQWISPHRLKAAQQLLWSVEYAAEAGLYRCRNTFSNQPAVTSF